MTDAAALTLVRPFETGALDWPGVEADHETAGRVLFLNARPAAFPDQLKPATRAIQPERGLFLDLQAHGFAPVPLARAAEVAADGPFACAFILAARQRAENEAMIAMAASCVAPGGRVVMAGGVSSGVEAIEKAMKAAGNDVAAQSKHHARVFWLSAPVILPARWTMDSRAIAARAPDDGPGTPESAGPLGGFSSRGVDDGSAFLINHLPEEIAGSVADLGAGWGWLSAEILRRRRKVKSVTLIESRHESLEASKALIAPLAGEGVKAVFHWLDVTREPMPRAPGNIAFDWVVTNPPFHDALGSHAPDLGRAFIRKAAAMLRAGGRLAMVANRQLPYEAELATHFKTVETIAENGRYKVFAARK
jgi:16S rRNA (guanine1207-N2)-methyltransferase